MKPAFHTLISVEDLSALMQVDAPILLDCRYSLADFNEGRKSYLKGHIPGAYYMDLAHDLSAPVINGITGRHPLPDPEVLTSSLIAAGLSGDSQVVVYDHSNAAYAARAWWLLNWLGHERVAILNGGFQAWTSKTLPVENQWPPPKDGDFTYNIQTQHIAEKDEVASGGMEIIDSRDYRRFTGETEPIDPVAGHIKDAICIPYLDNTDEKGYWKTPDFLKAKFSTLKSPGEKPPVFYCGSGVTACHNIFAYKLATGKEARLYPGSWSEWINYYPAVTGT